MIYRKGTLQDTQRIYDLICKLEETELPFNKFSKIYQEQLTSNQYYCLVHEENGFIIGVLNLRFEKQLHHCEDIAEIMEFIVDPNYRNRGIGREMLSSACQIAKQFGCCQIEVSSNQSRKKAHHFYLREGMHHFHFKFSKSLKETGTVQNVLGNE